MIAVVLSFKKEHHKPCDTKTVMNRTLTSAL